MAAYGTDAQGDAEQRAYARGYAAGKKFVARPHEPRPEPVFPPDPLPRDDLSGKPMEAWPLDRRLQFVAVAVAAWTGCVKFHAEGLVSSRKNLAGVMKLLEEALCEVELAVVDPFAQADRNPKGHDAEERHGAKHESPVANGDAPQAQPQGGDA